MVMIFWYIVIICCLQDIFISHQSREWDSMLFSLLFRSLLKIANPHLWTNLFHLLSWSKLRKRWMNISLKISRPKIFVHLGPIWNPPLSRPHHPSQKFWQRCNQCGFVLAPWSNYRLSRPKILIHLGPIWDQLWSRLSPPQSLSPPKSPLSTSSTPIPAPHHRNSFWQSCNSAVLAPWSNYSRRNLVKTIESGTSAINIIFILNLTFITIM